MDTFEQFFLTEWKLPKTSNIVNVLILKGYIDKIIARAPRALKNRQAIRIGSFEHTNPYNQQREVIDVRVVYEPNVPKLGVAQLNKNREDTTYWFILFNWPVIMKEYRRTRQPIKHILIRTLRHEIGHTIDPQAKRGDRKATEENAFLGDIVDDIRYAVKNGRTNLDDIKAQITKPTKEMINWIDSLSGKERKLLKLYARTQPDVIQRLRKVLSLEVVPAQP